MNKYQKFCAGLSKKVLSIATIIILYINTGYGQTSQYFEPGTLVYVSAPSGLSLRVSPHLQAPVIKVIPLGHQVSIDTMDIETDITNIEWVEGKWIKISHEGDFGYVFDGYLSTLIPAFYDFEKCWLDMDLIYPIESWVEVRLDLQSVDTINENGNIKTSLHFSGGEKMTASNFPGMYQMSLTFNESVRIMDVYHLLLSMLDKPRQKTFVNHSVFIKDHSNVLTQVKINLDYPIYIKKNKHNKTEITLYSYNYHCTL